MTKEEIKNVITQMAEEAENEYQKVYDKDYKPFLDTIGASVNSWDDAEDVYFDLVFPLNEGIAKKCMNENPKISKKAAFVISNYYIFSLIIRKLADMGAGCSADMARWIMKEYINHLNDENYVPVEINHSQYYMPDFGTTAEWMDFVEGIFKMFRTGDTLEFVEKRAILMSYKEEAIAIQKRRQAAIKKYTGPFKFHLNKLYQQNKISLDEYNFCFTPLGSAVIWSFVDRFLKDEYNITDEELIHKIKEVENGTY